MSWSTIAITVAALAVAAALVVWRVRVRATARQSLVFLGEVQGEIKKVTWPDRQQLKNATGVIILFVIAVAIIIGLMDIILQGIFVKWLPTWFHR